MSNAEYTNGPRKIGNVAVNHKMYRGEQIVGNVGSVSFCGLVEVFCMIRDEMGGLARRSIGLFADYDSIPECWWNRGL